MFWNLKPFWIPKIGSNFFHGIIFERSKECLKQLCLMLKKCTLPAHLVAYDLKKYWSRDVTITFFEGGMKFLKNVDHHDFKKVDLKNTGILNRLKQTHITLSMVSLTLSCLLYSLCFIHKECRTLTLSDSLNTTQIYFYSLTQINIFNYQQIWKINYLSMPQWKQDKYKVLHVKRLLNIFLIYVIFISENLFLNAWSIWFRYHENQTIKQTKVNNHNLQRVC